LADCLFFGLPSKVAFKDNVGPNDLAMVGDEDSGEGDGERFCFSVEALNSSSAGETVGVGVVLTTGNLDWVSWARLFTVWY